MSELQNPSGVRLAHYIHEAMLLLQSICFNEYDKSDVASRGQSLVYIFDADIVHMFMHPADNIKYVDVFDFEADKKREERKQKKRRKKNIPAASTPAAEDQLALRLNGVLIAGAAICAEHMFSGKLPRQFKSGGPNQSPSPRAYIAYDHVTEVVNFADHLSKKEKNWPAAEATFSEKVMKITEPMRTLAENYLRDGTRSDPNAYLETVHRMMPKLLEQWPIDESYAISQMQRLYDDQLLIDADKLLAWTPDIQFPPEESVRDWYSKITASTRDELELPLSVSIAEQRKIERSINYINSYRDACVLSQIETLNRGADDDLDYVLVTGARRLHLAFARWKNAHDNDQLPMHKRAFLRHPRQYIPLTNVDDPSAKQQNGALSHKEVDLKETLGDFLNLYFKPHELPSNTRPDQMPPFATVGDIVTDMTKVSEDKVKDSARLIDQIRAKWLEIVEDATVSNTPDLEKICPEALGRIAEAASEAKVRKALSARIGKNLAEVRTGQARSQQTQALLRMLSAGLRGIPRSQAYICEPFPWIREPYHDTSEFLAALETKGAKERERLLSLVVQDADQKSEPAYRALLFIGYICLQMNMFLQAISYLDRARKTFKDKEDPEAGRYEILYCWSVAIRYHDLQGTLYKRAKAYLSSCIEYHGGHYLNENRDAGEPSHHFRYLRDNYEAAALRQSYLTNRKSLIAKEQIADPQLRYEELQNPEEELEKEITDYLTTAGKLLSETRLQNWEKARYRQMGLKVAGLKCSNFIYKAAVGGQSFENLNRAEASNAIKELEDRMKEEASKEIKSRAPDRHGSQPHFLYKWNCLALDWLNQKVGSDERIVNAKALRDFIANKAVTRSMTPVDKYEFDIISQRVDEELRNIQ